MNKNFVLPNYDNCILNITSSIVSGLGGKTPYKNLKTLPAKEIKNTKNVILLVIDGLGFEYLKKYCKGSFLEQNIKDKVTSVFPSATSAAITTFNTGVSCATHGIPSWYTYLEEFGTIIIPLPYVTKLKPNSDFNSVIKIHKLFNLNSIFDKINVNGYKLMPDKLKDSRFTRATGGNSKRIGYKKPRGMFKELKKIIKSNNRKKYVYSYYDIYDILCHKHGTTGKKTIKDFLELDKELQKFVKSIKNTNTKIIITADHGHINVPKNKKIIIQKYPKINSCLRVPLCGDNRYQYCFVKPEKEKEFVRLVKTKLKHACEIYKSSDLLKMGIFGKGNNPDFEKRIGDYTLIAKKDYAIYDIGINKNKKKKLHVGEHGGLSSIEMYVPLIVIDAG